MIARLTKDADPGAIAAVGELARAVLGPNAVDVVEELGRPWARLWFSSGEARVDGVLIVWHVADEIHVLSVATHPDARRRGIAKALLAELFVYARESAIRVLVLEVRRSNDAAIGLYRAHGFTVLGVRKRYYADNDEDAIEMMLGLDAATGRALSGKDEVSL